MHTPTHTQARLPLGLALHRLLYDFYGWRLGSTLAVRKDLIKSIVVKLAATKYVLMFSR